MHLTQTHLTAGPGAPPLLPAPWTSSVLPVFLVGAPRSGTTWLQAMLASHPEVYSGPETHFGRLYSPLWQDYARTRAAHFGVPRYLGEAEFHHFLRASFWTLVSGLPEPAAPPRFFLEKTPDHCLHGEMLRRLFPGARFLHLVRDPRAVVASLLRGSAGWAQDWAPRTVPEAVEWWTRHVAAGRSLGAELGADRYLELRYEDLRRAPEQGLSAILRWLGLPGDAALCAALAAEHALERTRETRGVCASIANSVALPEGFVGAAAVNPDDLDLRPSQRLLVEDLCAPLMAELGYAPGSGRRTARFSASVVLVCAGDDPAPIFHALLPLAESWREDWELVLVSPWGAACRLAAASLDGDFRVLENPEPVSSGEALRQAARAASAEELLVLGPDGPLAIPRAPARDEVRLDSLDEASLLEWLQAAAQPLRQAA